MNSNSQLNYATGFAPESSQSSSISANVRTIEAQALTSREAEKIRSENTKKSYLSKQKEYKQWCDSVFYETPAESRYTVYGDKLHLFLKDCVSSHTYNFILISMNTYC